MLVKLKFEIVRRGIRQTRMAVQLGWDPAKLSRIVNEIVKPTPADRRAISAYLKRPESCLFAVADDSNGNEDCRTETTFGERVALPIPADAARQLS